MRFRYHMTRVPQPARAGAPGAASAAGSRGRRRPEGHVRRPGNPRHGGRQHGFPEHVASWIGLDLTGARLGVRREWAASPCSSTTPKFICVWPAAGIPGCAGLGRIRILRAYPLLGFAGSCNSSAPTSTATARKWNSSSTASIPEHNGGRTASSPPRQPRQPAVESSPRPIPPRRALHGTPEHRLDRLRHRRRRRRQTAARTTRTVGRRAGRPLVLRRVVVRDLDKPRAVRCRARC